MRRGVAISLIGHGAILIWALVTFARPLQTLQGETFPVDVLSTDEFSKIALGDPNAPKAETPKPIVDKIAEPTPPPEDPTASVDKIERKAAVEEPPPEPAPPKPEPKPVEKVEPEKKVDPIAEALKKDEAKKPEKKPEPKPQPVKKPEIKERTFDKRQTAELLNKLKPTRVASAGTELNNVVSRGAPKGAAVEMSANEADAIGQHVKKNWNKPAGVDRERLILDIELTFNIDGTFAKPPVIKTRGSGPLYEALKVSAEQALNRSVPFYFLNPARYEAWKNFVIAFDTKDVK